MTGQDQTTRARTLRAPEPPLVIDLFDGVRKSELSRSLKHAEFIQAAQDGASASELCGIKQELDALTEIATAALSKLLDELKNSETALK